MHDVITGGEHAAIPGLGAFVRNRYFYGKLLDVHHLDMEQRYLNEKRWLVNRLGLGAGVLGGLEVEPTSGNAVVVRPGVAIDGRGREVVVPEPFVVEDALALTDDRGRPTGERVGAVGTLCLAFHECGVEPAPVLVSDCEVREECTHGAVRERFRILVHDGPPKIQSAVDCPALAGREEGAPAAAVADTPARELRAAMARAGAAATHLEAGDPRLAAAYRALCRVIDTSGAPPERDCVPIAVVVPGAADGDVRVEYCGVRVPILSNVMLLDLLLCVARAMARPAAGARTLRYEMGDGSSVEVAGDLGVAATLLDPDGAGVAGEEVVFRVRSGDGAVGGGRSRGPTATVTTADDGLVRTTWRMGDKPGLKTLEAQEPGGARIVFHALAEKGT